MNRALVMIPSRDRPRQLDEAVKSVLDTSEADVAVYIDDDQQGYYGTADHPRVKQVFGPRVGPAGATNILVDRFQDYAAYGLVTDDSQITTAGWDQWLLHQLDQYTDRLLVVSPSHNHGRHVDMPFLSKEWVRVLGWFALPRTIQYGWPTAVYVMALEIGRLKRAPEEAFHIQHSELSPDRYIHFVADSATLYNFFISGMYESVLKLRAAMKQ